MEAKPNILAEAVVKTKDRQRKCKFAEKNEQKLDEKKIENISKKAKLTGNGKLDANFLVKLSMKLALIQHQTEVKVIDDDFPMML